VDLPKRLPLEPVPAGTQWLRIHSRDKKPLWFGPASGTPPVHRFDDPLGVYRVCYLGTSLQACFAETFLRNPPVRILAFSDLAGRAITTVEVRRKLRLVPLSGPALATLGATAELAAGSSYQLSQAWSRALWHHPDAPDGITYRSRHDDSAYCLALFHRAASLVQGVTTVPFPMDTEQLAKLLKRYNLGLTR
jgi:hypothetical protein